METTNTTNYPELDAAQLLSKMRVLSEINLELSNIQDSDELYKQVIIQAHERLGFDRLGLYLLDLEAEQLTGTYGISKNGQLQSDKEDGFYFSDGEWVENFVFNEKRFTVEEDVDLWEDQEVIGHGWKASAALWIRDTPVGVFFADNLISQEPFQPHLPELLLAYSTDVANLINRLHTEEALQKSQATLQDTLERQQTLHDISLELSSIQDMDELYKQIILKARENLGFDRIGLFLVNLDNEELNGTYGINPGGELVSIKHDQFNFSDGNWVKRIVYSEERVFAREDTDLLEGNEVIGRGWHLTATMKIRGTLVGVIFADNMVSQQPFQPHLPELLSAYSTDAANLIDRLHVDIALRQSEQVIQESLEKQQILHNVNLELATIEDLDELCQQIIIKGKEELGFDRLGLYLLNEDKESMTGTYGVNDDGNIHSLASDIIVFTDQSRIENFVNQKERQIVLQDTQLFDGPEEVLGEGWHITTSLWNRDIPVGVLFADNLLSHTPLQPYQSDLLSSYCSTAANLINRMSEAQALRESEQTMQEFLEKQQELHEISIHLSDLGDSETILKEAILLGKNKLGFDRLGLYLFDSDRGVVHGTYGIGIDGNLRREYHLEHNLDEEPWMQRFLYHNERLDINEDSPLYEDSVVVGHGWNATAALWNRGRPMGLLFTDNLMNHQPLKPFQPELLSAYGATIANLIGRNQAEIERIHLLENAEQQAKDLAQLNELSTELNQAQTISEIYQLAGKYTAKIIGGARASLALISDDNSTFEVFGLSGLEGAIPLGMKLPIAGTAVGITITESRLTSFPQEGPLDAYPDSKKLAESGIRCTMSAPLIISGKAIGSINIGNNIDSEYSEQKQTLMMQVANLIASAMQVKREQDRVQTILQSITVPMLITRLKDGHVFYLNEQIATQVGSSVDELLGNQAPDFYANPKDRAHYLERLKETGVLENYELLLKRDDGSLYWGMLSGKIINYEGEQSLISTVIDISEGKAAEAAIIKQAEELQTVADLSTQITSIQDQQELLETIVQETQKRFDLYHCHIFLIDEAGKNLGIRACGWHPDAPEYGTHGDTVISIKAKQSLVAQAAQTLQPVVINDVMSDPNWLPNALLPDTRSELAVPMLVGNRVIGVLDVQSTEIDRFSAEDIKIQLTLASQIAVGLENAQSLERSKAAVAELDALTRRLTRESWEDYLSDLEETDTGFVYNLGKLSSMQDADEGETEEETAVSPTNSHLSQSLMVHGETIGHLTAFHEADTEQLGDDAALIMAAVAEQLSARVENIRLTDQTQRALAQTQDQAQRLETLNEISAEMSDVDTLNQVFDVIFARIPNLLDVDRVSLAMLRPDRESLEIIGYKGVEMGAATGAIVSLSGTIMDRAIKENRVFRSDTSSTDGSLNSSMVAPLSSSGRTIGTLNVGSKKTDALTISDETLMQQLAAMLSSVIDNKQLLAAAQARAERELQVRTITDKIRRGVDREAILNIAQQEISTLIGAKQSAAQLGTKAQLLERIQQTIEQTQKESN